MQIQQIKQYYIVVTNWNRTIADLFSKFFYIRFDSLFFFWQSYRWSINKMQIKLPNYPRYPWRRVKSINCFGAKPSRTRTSESKIEWIRRVQNGINIAKVYGGVSGFDYKSFFIVRSDANEKRRGTYGRCLWLKRNNVILLRLVKFATAYEHV